MTLCHLFIFDSCPDCPHPFLTMPTQKFFHQLLIFVITHQHAKNQFISSIYSSDIVNFRVPSPDWPHPFLTKLAPNIFNHLLICVKLYQHAKNQLALSALSWHTVNFRVQIPDWPYSFLNMPHQKLVSICKKCGCLVDYFWRNAWFKNPIIWMALSILAYISGTPFFPNRRFVQKQQII